MPERGLPGRSDHQPTQRALEELRLRTEYASPTWGPTFPASPINGQVHFYVADDTNGSVWQFRYRSESASTYKWEFVGGTSIYKTAASGTESGTGYGEITSGVAQTMPFAGDYFIRFVMEGEIDDTGAAAWVKWDTATPGDDSTALTFWNSSDVGDDVVTDTLRFTGVAASTTYRLYARLSGSTNQLFWWNLRTELFPIRVSG